MITQISLQNVATFGSEVQTMSDLKKLNFVFGTNGSGKTTISRVLRAPDDYSSCAIVWENEKRIPCKVYNSDFVAENFRDDSDMIVLINAKSSDEFRSALVPLLYQSCTNRTLKHRCF